MVSHEYLHQYFCPAQCCLFIRWRSREIFRALPLRLASISPVLGSGENRPASFTDGIAGLQDSVQESRADLRGCSTH